MHARIGGEGAGQVRGECRSERASLPRALPRWHHALPHAELELGGLVEGQDVDERAGRVDGRDEGAAALLRRLFRDPLPAARALAPAARLERDDRALGEDRDHARHAELGRGTDDPLHLVALRHRLDERDAQRGLGRARRDAEDGAGRGIADRLEAHRVVAPGAVGREHGVAGPEAQDAHDVARLVPVEDDAPALDPLRRDREAAHRAPAEA